MTSPIWPHSPTPEYPSAFLLTLVFAVGWTIGHQPGAARYVDALETDSRTGRAIVATVTVLEVAISVGVLIVLLPLVLVVGAILLGWAL